MLLLLTLKQEVYDALRSDLDVKLTLAHWGMHSSATNLVSFRSFFIEKKGQSWESHYSYISINL